MILYIESHKPGYVTLYNNSGFIKPGQILIDSNNNITILIIKVTGLSNSIVSFIGVKSVVCEVYEAILFKECRREEVLYIKE